MTRPPAYHPGNFLMKNMNPTNSGLTIIAKLYIPGAAGGRFQNSRLDIKVIDN